MATDTEQCSAISIHAPRTGSDGSYEREYERGSFQSTLPARGATGANAHQERDLIFQSTLPARGATRLLFHRVDCAGISIHAPRTGSDAPETQSDDSAGDFNPRSPHGERRPTATLWRALLKHFNPRSPHGERPRPSSRCPSSSAFQSTLPARGATASARRRASRRWNFNPRSPHGERHAQLKRFLRQPEISIHAPRTGSDS